MSVIFNKEKHTYTNPDTNEIYISASQLIGRYKHKFDPDGRIAANCARKEGISVEEMKARWKDKADKSCEFGTQIHETLENYILTKTMPEPDTVAYKWVQGFTDLQLTGELIPEMMLWSDEDKIAGCSDLVILEGDYVSVIDHKTNEKIDFYSKYDKYLKPPLDHISECSWLIYSLQLSLYGYLLEQRGYKVKELKLLWYTYLNNKPIVKYLPCPYLKSDVINMLNDYKSQMKLK